jgi:iron complex transport system permease protein
MKVTIDLDKLLAEGKISQEEHDRFSLFAARSTGALAFNMFIGFGVIAVAIAALALVPSATTALLLGLIICAGGIALIQVADANWIVLGNICVLTGALLFGGGAFKLGEGSIPAFLLVTVVFAAIGILVRSSLLIVLAGLTLSSCLGARTDYLHATYFLGIQEPALTAAFFTLFSIGIYQLSKHIKTQYEGLAIAAARTGVFLVNFALWIGSLWGDKTTGLPDWIFGILWAVALIAAGIWGWQANRRWLVNVITVFGGIHFYTQWFERLGASPGTVLLAGLIALGFAFGLRMLNARLGKDV